MIVIGLISGTSADGTDVAVVDIKGQPPHLAWQLLHFMSVPHPPVLRKQILLAMQPETSRVDQLCCLNVDLGEQFAQAALEGMAEANLTVDQVSLIGSHGQTLWHAPEHHSPATFQLGEAAVIAERTGCAVVNNFRARDMAAGGQGAPLVSYVDVVLLSHETRVRAAQNIGGIGNVTFLPPHNRPDLRPLAFDTGPGNVLLDIMVSQLTQGAASYDQNGQMAAQGHVNKTLLTILLDHSYFDQQPPKSTGRELFNQAYLEAVRQQFHASTSAEGREISSEDIMATLTAFTAYSIARAYQDFLPLRPDEIIISGGGVQNITLLTMLNQILSPTTLIPSDQLGLPSEAKEAIAFAIMAYETWHHRPSNLPIATGATRPVVLGQITQSGSVAA